MTTIAQQLIYDKVASKLQLEMQNGVVKLESLIDEGDITTEKLNEITNLMILVSNLNQAYALSKTIGHVKPKEEEK
tara:strand:+ start:600 stop:827 length:228 start_codon:yes stop_codon:yes gene_type:complete